MYKVPDNVRIKSISQNEGKKYVTDKGIFQVLGQRAQQEDFYTSTEIIDGIFWHAVYDGHRGKEIARAVSETLPIILSKSIKASFDLKDEEWCKNVNKVEEVIINAFHETDREVFKPYLISVGSTCTGVLSIPDKNILYFAQLGDSHACLFGLHNEIIFSTVEHKPNKPYEFRRITGSGGFVTEPLHAGPKLISPSRVNGILAVSRSFGDWDFEESCKKTNKYPQVCITKTKKGDIEDYWCLISKTPEVSYVDLSNIKEKELCLIVCSDGLTDEYKDMVIRSFLLDHQASNKTFCTKKIGEHINIFRGLEDNTTCIIIIQKNL